MTNYAETYDIVLRFLKARVPLIVIRSIEPNRVMQLLGECAASLKQLGFYEHSRTDGLRELISGQLVSDDYSLTGALEQARTTFKSRSNVNFVFPDVEELDQESSTSRHFAEMVRLAESRQGSIIIVTQRPVWTGLGRLGMTASLSLPDTDEMFVALDEMISDHRGMVNIEWQHDEIRQAAEILSGVTEMEAVNVLATMLAKGAVVNDDIAELSRFKDQIFGDLSGIERVHLRQDYSVGGLRNLRSWLANRESLMRADLSGSPLHPPRGILLVGVPGCGKSLSAKAIASEWRLPLYRLDMSGILGMYVGQSESQLREALETAERVAPCVLWIDEIEKALAGGGGDSGTTRRLIGQFLFWLQESTSKVFMVATANEVQSLPSELLRKGRFDEIFFVDLPDERDREEILRMYFQQLLDTDPPPDLLGELVHLSDGFSGSDIQSVVHDLAVKRFTDPGRRVPTDEDMRSYFRNIVPYSHTNSEDVSAIRAWGQNRCIPAGASGAVDQAAPVSGIRRVVLN